MSTYTLKVDPEFNDVRLDVFLAKNFSEAPSRTFVKKLIDAGHVSVNKKAAKANYKVTDGDQVHVEIPRGFLAPDHIDPENIPLNIFYEDEYLMVVNKPVGMLVHPAAGIYSGTLVNALLYHCKKLSKMDEFRPGIVHRLDQETSGLMVAAKDNKTHAKLAKQFEEHHVMKRYVALVEGEIEFDQGVIDASIGRHPRYRDRKAVQLDDDSAKEAITFYEVLKRKGGVTLVALFPQSGRTHQLRVHMAHLKHPVLGDEKYGRKMTFSRLALHAQSLGFVHPVTKCYIEFSSIVPKEFFDKVR